MWTMIKPFRAPKVCAGESDIAPGRLPAAGETGVRPVYETSFVGERSGEVWDQKVETDRPLSRLTRQERSDSA